MEKTKAQLNWEVSREQEENFIEDLVLVKMGNKEDLKEFFKMIRSCEYRRGKEDGIKQCQESTQRTSDKEIKQRSFNEYEYEG